MKGLEARLKAVRRGSRLFFIGAMMVVCVGVQAQVMLGAYVPGDGWSSDEIIQWNQKVGQKAAFINIFSSFSHNWEWHLNHQVSNISAEQAVPMISWMPIDRSRPQENILTEIVDGDWDIYLSTWIESAQRWLESQSLNESQQEPRLMIRFAHEFNGSWYSYSNQPELYIEAWQYIHRLFNDYTVNGRILNDYIEWVWCPNNNSFDEVQGFTQYYPGDAFVDWTAIDGYNWGSNFTWSQWQSFSDVFDAAYDTLKNKYPTKPIMIAEVGSTNPKDVPEMAKGQAGTNEDVKKSKNRWFKTMAKQLPNKFPLIKAVCIFNINKELGWAIYGQTSQGIKNSGLKGLKSAMRKHPNLFTGDYLSSK